MFVSLLTTALFLTGAEITPEAIRSRLTNLPAKHRILTDMQWSPEVVRNHAVGKSLERLILHNAETILQQPPAERELTGRRLLTISRLVLYRVNTLCMAYHLTGKKDYADRAIREMLAAAKFSDWNPTHFLDVGEMALAIACGVDFLGDAIPASDREILLEALTDKALRPSWPAKTPWWVFGKNNWTQVCHAGLLAAALVTAERNPELAAKTIARAISAQELVMKTSYSPNGVYPEGPSYWYYGTEFEVLLIAMLEHAFGTDFGLHQIPGWDKTGDFMRSVFGPSGRAYNFSDGSDVMGDSMAQFYLAKHFSRPDYLAPEHLEKIHQKAANTTIRRAMDNRLLPLALLWLPEIPVKTAEQPLFYWSAPQASMPLALLRTTWDKDALFLGIKGGSPSSPHGHMDSGSFIFEAEGVRWVLDPGAENYHKIESLKMNVWNMGQKSDRWKIFRLGPDAHSILRINHKPQQVRGTGVLTIQEQPGNPLPMIHLDLSQVYSEQAQNVQRTADLQQDRLRITDRITGAKPGVPVQFQFLTQAKGKVITPETLVLTQQKKRLQVTAPAGAVWKITPAESLLQSFDTPFKKPLSLVSFTLPADKDGFINWTVDFQPRKKKVKRRK